MGSFLTIDCHLRSAKFIVLTGLNLDKDNIFAINGNNVYFLPISPPIAFQYLITFIDKILCSQVFTHLAQ